ncbi:MAG TPA: Rrf2 family transcriptional regulator [Candidatus Tenderia electrophaga]|uniref:Rrf2 family transcriptional regulator n=1 Tax=Candidatus Tenderia electrophaga TaxID=1748243 RepID=A0A832J721_9GAMM|nr:Rrf2 family transcriptional regulator [Candidatus Tenderia electrophaga]
MKLSTKGRYAITAMLDLALNANNGNKVTLADISEFQGISLSYLEQLFARLRQTKLVTGTRGPGGGYRLSRSASEISVAEIIHAVDDRTGKEKVMKVSERHQKTQQLWQSLSENINDYLTNISLGDLIDNYKPDSATAPTDNKLTIDDSSTESWPNLQRKQTSIV